MTVRGERRYLWRAVDQESLPHERSEFFGYGDVLDILVQERKGKRAAESFFKKLMKGQGRSAREIVTDKLPSYGAARKTIMSTSMHCCDRIRGLVRTLCHAYSVRVSQIQNPLDIPPRNIHQKHY